MWRKAQKRTDDQDCSICQRNKASSRDQPVICTETRGLESHADKKAQRDSYSGEHWQKYSHYNGAFNGVCHCRKGVSKNRKKVL